MTTPPRSVAQAALLRATQPAPAGPRPEGPLRAELLAASPGEGITVAVHRGGAGTVARLEYPMRMVDPGMVALARQAMRAACW